MDDTLRSRHNRNKKVDQCLIDKATELAATAASVATLQTQLAAKIAETESNDIIATADNTGIAESKNAEREELTQSARICISFLVKHYTTTGNRVQLRLIDFKKSELENADDTTFFEKSKFINDTATPIMAALTAIGYTAPLKAAFDTNLTEFSSWLGKPREAISESSAYRNEVIRNLREADDILALIDVEINLLEYSNPILFDTYYGARKIDDPAGGSGSSTTANLLPGEKKAVATFVYIAVTSFTIQNTGSVALDFSFQLAGSQVGNIITVNPGDTTNKPKTDFHTDGDTLLGINSSLVTGTAKISIT